MRTLNEIVKEFKFHPDKASKILEVTVDELFYFYDDMPVKPAAPYNITSYGALHPFGFSSPKQVQYNYDDPKYKKELEQFYEDLDKWLQIRVPEIKYKHGWFEVVLID